MIFCRKAYHFAQEADRKNRQANTAVPCLPNTGQFSCPHKNFPRKQPQTKISYSIFLQKEKEILKILLLQENPLTNIHTHRGHTH